MVSGTGAMLGDADTHETSSLQTEVRLDSATPLQMVLPHGDRHAEKSCANPVAQVGGSPALTL